jgi:hypothetical protein
MAGPPGTHAENDESLLHSLPPDLRVERTYAPSWLWSLRNFGERIDERLRPKTQARGSRGVAGLSEGHRLAGLFESWADRFVPIDGDVFFVPYAAAMAARLVRDVRPDVVYVSGYPYSAFLVGAMMRLLFRVPLVCELRDPWTLNVQFEARHPSVMALERKLERWVFDTADRVIVTTDSVREAYERVYPHLPSGHIRRIYSSYDEGLAPAGALPPLEGPFTIAHFGSFYGALRLCSGRWLV